MVEKKKNILLVEDDPAIVDIYQMTIKKGGFNVQISNSGQGALKIIKDALSGDQAKPSLILLDLILPDISGIEVLKEIKRNETTKDIKVFFLTNQQHIEEKELGGVAPDKFIIKANISPSELLELIKKDLE